jgi:flotillin
MMLEKIENIAKINSEAIKNIKFDKITVWDSGNSTGDFIGGLLKSLPPISETFKSVGMNLPAFLQGKEEVKKDEPKKLNS